MTPAATQDLNRAGELLASALENLTLGINASRVQPLPGVDSDAEWRRRVAEFDLRLARFYLAVARDQLLHAHAEARRLLIESVH